MVNEASTAPRRAQHPGPHPPVERDQVDPVPGPGRERGEQQRGVHRRVQPRDAADPAGRGPAGVQHDDDPPVPLGPPGPHHHVPAAGRRPPVDRADVVADDVLAQRVELGARPAQHRPVLAVELAQLGQLLGKVPAAAERRQHPHGHAARWRPCRPARPSGPNERTMTAADSLSPRRSGVSVLAAVAWPPAGAVSVPGPARVRARRPGGPHLGPQRPAARVVHGHRDRGGLAQQHPGVAGPGDVQPPHAGRQHQVGERSRRAARR